MTSLARELWLTIDTEILANFCWTPTSLRWAVSFVVIMILGHNKWHIEGNGYTYTPIHLHLYML